jgi:hypothetical protein
MPLNLRYRQGGNPPINPGLFLADDAQPGGWKRIAWWPAGKLPDQALASRVLLAYEAKGSVLSRTEVRALRDKNE